MTIADSLSVIHDDRVWHLNPGAHIGGVNQAGDFGMSPAGDSVAWFRFRYLGGWVVQRLHSQAWFWVDGVFIDATRQFKLPPLAVGSTTTLTVAIDNHRVHLQVTPDCPIQPAVPPPVIVGSIVTEGQPPASPVHGSLAGDSTQIASDSPVVWDLSSAADVVVGRRGGPADVQIDGVDIELQHVRLRWNGEYLDVRSLAARLRPIVRSAPVLQARVGANEQFMIGHGTFQISPTGLLQLLPRLAFGDRARLRLRGVSLQYRTAKVPTTKDISFDLGAHEVLAVIGPSGAGKSTLCSAFTGGVKVVAGRLFLGGVGLAKAGDQLKNLVSFVPQQPDLYPELRVRQSLLQVARLRLATDLRDEDRMRRVEDVIEQVQLGKDAEKLAGSLSGGQKKRLSIAMELLSDPMLLVLDEPTSGLDEGLDRSLMRMLREIAGRGCAVVVVTHSMVNLDQADQVLAVAAGGHRGFLGSPRELLAAFEAHDYATVMDRLRQGRAVGPTDRLVSESNVPVDPDASPGRSKSNGRQFSTLLFREFARQHAVLKSMIRTAILYPLIVVGLTYSAASAASRSIKAQVELGQPH